MDDRSCSGKAYVDYDERVGTRDGSKSGTGNETQIAGACTSGAGELPHHAILPSLRLATARITGVREKETEKNAERGFPPRRGLSKSCSIFHTPRRDAASSGTRDTSRPAEPSVARAESIRSLSLSLSLSPRAALESRARGGSLPLSPDRSKRDSEQRREREALGSLGVLLCANRYRGVDDRRLAQQLACDALRGGHPAHRLCQHAARRGDRRAHGKRAGRRDRPARSKNPEHELSPNTTARSRSRFLFPAKRPSQRTHGIMLPPL